VAWARIFLGVHFPLDMVGAVMVVVVTYAIVNLAWTKIGDGITYYIVSLYRKIFAWPISSGWIKR
jgi:undecaprenyl-diphosphatase